MLKINNQKEFQKALNKFKSVPPDLLKDIIKKTAFDTFADLQEHTPEDTRRAKGGWNVTVDSPPSEWKPPAGEKRYPLQRFSGDGKIKFDSLVNLSNNVEYIIPLDEGHSKQRPEGIVNPVMARATAQLQRLLAVLKKRKYK